MSGELDCAQIRAFLKQKERVLICLPDGEAASQVADAVVRAGCIPVLSGSDFRWGTLLRRCFTEGIRVVAGHGECILGLAKLASVWKTPLRIRSAIVTHGVSPDWLVDGIENRLDCSVLNLSLEPNLLQPQLQELSRELLSWTSVLDLRLRKGDQGLELEMVYFPGEKQPKLPTVARQVMKPLDPGTDSPFFLENFR